MYGVHHTTIQPNGCKINKRVCHVMFNSPCKANVMIDNADFDQSINQSELP